MNLVKWWLFRRWVFISAIKLGTNVTGDTVNEMYMTNFAGCMDYPSINRDMAKISSKLNQ